MPDPDPGDVVTEVRQRLDGLADRPAGEHGAVYDDVHRLLQDALARIDEG